MEDTLRDETFDYEVWQERSLNPCFNGRYSQRAKAVKNLKVKGVLILVLMEDTLREQDIRILCISWIGIYKTNNACSC